MRIIGNLLWWLFGGLEAAIGYFTGSLALACTIIGIPFAFHIERHGLPDRLHSHPIEFTLADFRRIVGLPHAFVLRFAPMPHAHRHSLGKTAFQDGRAFACTVRQGCRVRILARED